MSKMLSLLQRIVAKVPFVNTFLCSSVPKPAENLAFLYHYRQRNTTVPSQPVIKDPSPGGGSACGMLPVKRTIKNNKFLYRQPCYGWRYFMLLLYIAHDISLVSLHAVSFEVVGCCSNLCN